MICEMKKKSGMKSGRLFYLGILAVPIICFILFYVVINFNSIILAFQDYWYDGNKIVRNFNHLENFKNLVRLWNGSNAFLIYIRNSFMYIGLLIFVIMPLTLFFSYYIYKNNFLGNFFKIVIFMPSVVCTMVLVIFYDGFVEKLLAAVFKPENGYMVNYKTTLPFLIIFYVATGFSANILIFLNAMSQVPLATVEAAKIDGAGELKTFFHIVIPSIWNTVVSLFVIALAAFGSEQGNLHAFLSTKPKTMSNYFELQTQVVKDFRFRQARR